MNKVPQSVDPSADLWNMLNNDLDFKKYVDLYVRNYIWLRLTEEDMKTYRVVRYENE